MNPVDEDRALDGEYTPASGARGREAMDPTTRHLALIACGIGLLLVVLIGGWALSGRRNGAIPVIAAPAGPVRVKPVNPGGMQADGPAGFSLGSDGGKDSLAPAPETPQPGALAAEVEAARHREAAQRPPIHAPPLQAPPSQATSPPKTTPPPAPPPTQAPDASRLRTDASGGARAVQLAAVDSDAAALSEWARLRHAHPELFAGRTPRIERADHDGHVIYRLRTRGFADTAAAATFCAAARKARVACAVADF
ncbi:SPOR domain-containing protein [Lichenicoccus sp.]|uniref:SPOR domain-containing protein n=1 Tax=Lichenicoccus sp. TaxID=2781899 RepID=UPI003D11C4EC